MTTESLDCLIIGGGPAGLTAAIYMARYRRDVRVVHDGDSRASWIPTSHNHAGFPEGISGTDLLARMEAQAIEYGAPVERGRVTKVTREGELFAAETGGGAYLARNLILATGVVNRRPPMDEDAHEEALARGLIRYCPICDGFEVTGKRVAVIGSGIHSAREVRFLLTYTKDLTLIDADGLNDLGEEWNGIMDDAGIERIDGPVTTCRIDGDQLAVEFEDGAVQRYDSVYPAFGSDLRAGIADDLGAEISDEGIVVDRRLQTRVPGLYAIGDIAVGLSQISVAMGHAAIAAITIHNRLPLRS